VQRSGSTKPRLRRIHGDALYEQDSDARRSLDYHRTRTTEEIVESLRPGADESLKVKPDGRIFKATRGSKCLRSAVTRLTICNGTPSHEHE
jgi:3'-phosphoadenosine 5'-phosphosulfate sulfotransferase